MITCDLLTHLPSSVSPNTSLHAQNPVTGLTMAGITLIPNYNGVSNVVVRDALWNAARRGVCIGNYNTAVWSNVASFVPAVTPVLFNSEQFYHALHLYLFALGCVDELHSYHSGYSSSEKCYPPSALAAPLQTAPGSTPTCQASQEPGRCLMHP